jgi:hypothetical protein
MFFNQFPKALYSVQGDAIQTVITDYFRYVDVIDRLAQNSYAYNTVDIINAERPDTVSHRLYGTPDYYWTFFITNDSLKEGLSAWPKGDSEIKNYIANQYKNISAFRFPVGEADSQGRRSMITGIPFKNTSYSPYLRLCKVIGTEQNKRVFASAKIIDYDPNMSLIWIDNSDITWFAEDASVNAEVGTESTLDIKYSAESKINLFYISEASGDFSVQFRDNSTTIGLRKSFLDELRPIAVRFRPNAFFENYPDDILDANYTLTSTQYWKDGSLAPAHYYDPTNINEEISEYNAGPEASNYVSIYDDIIEENNLRKTIKVVDPIYIEAFAREFKKLLNE